MTENVGRLVDEECFYNTGITDHLFKQMSRELADRVIDRIIHEGECVCTYVEPRTMKCHSTCQVEMRMGVDIKKLVRCKHCEHHFETEHCVFCRKHRFGQVSPDFFCADGKEKEE